MSARSLRPNVHNPVADLPEFASIRELPPDVRKRLSVALLAIRRQARATAEKSWRQNKGPMAVYWKCVGVYAGHISRAVRP